MSFITNIQRGFHRAGKSLKKNAPTIMSVIACVGVVGTGVVTAKCHREAMEDLEEHDKATKLDLTFSEKTKILVPHYIWPAAIGGATIALILGSNALNKKQMAEVYGALIAIDQGYKAYRLKVNELLGEDADSQIRNEIARETFIKKDIPKKKYSDTTLFYEENSEQFFWSTMEDVKDAEYEFNRYFILKEEATLNDLLKFFGSPEAEFGNVLGWNIIDGGAFYGYSWVDFDHEYVDAAEFYKDSNLQCEDEELLSDVPGYWIIKTPFPPHVPYEE